MNFTREQVATMRRMMEVATPFMSRSDMDTMEHLADVLDGQLDMEDRYTDSIPTDEELEDMHRRSGMTIPF